MRQQKTCLSKRHPVCLSLGSNMAFRFPKTFIHGKGGQDACRDGWGIDQ